LLQNHNFLTDENHISGRLQVDHYFQPARWELLKGIKGQVPGLNPG
jgi:hypothetical protein